MSRGHAFHEPVDREVAKWPGVIIRREHRSKHLSLILTFAGNSRFVIYPLTPSDTRRGIYNHLSDVRRALIHLGAARRQPAHQLEAA